MFDVILPTYNNINELKACLMGFADQTFRDFKVIVCVDGSTDGTIEYLAAAQYSFRLDYLIHAGIAHKGRNETRNLSLQIVSSKYLLLFDTDIVPDKNLLQQHFDLLESKDCISTGEIVYQNTEKNVWALYIQTRGKSKYADLSKIPCYYLNTQNVAFKTEYFINLKGQDPELSLNYGGDDTILGYRMGKEFNVPVIFNKNAIGYSSMGKNLDTALAQMREFGAVNLKIIRRKYPEFKQIFRYDIVESGSFRYTVFRFFMRDKVAKVLRSIIHLFPVRIKIIIVHFLVFLSIYKGYKTGKY